MKSRSRRRIYEQNEMPILLFSSANKRNTNCMERFQTDNADNKRESDISDVIVVATRKPLLKVNKERTGDKGKTYFQIYLQRSF